MEYKDITYSPVGWKNYPSTVTKLNAENLLKMEDGIVNLVAGMLELRNVLGDMDISSGKDIIATLNALYSQFGGYEGYNLFDVSKLTEVSTGYAVDIDMELAGIVAGDSYTFSMEGDDTVYLYQYNNSGDIVSTETLSSASKSAAFTFNTTCTSFRVLYMTSVGYSTKQACVDANVMLEKGTEKHDFEPYTGGETMSSQWDEILQNRAMIAQNAGKISSLETFIAQLTEVLGGTY